jgi:hypothetical protein
MALNGLATRTGGSSRRCSPASVLRRGGDSCDEPEGFTSTAVTWHTHRWSQLGRWWPVASRPRATAAKPAASPAAGRSGDAWPGRVCARGGARQGECGGVCGCGRGGLERRNVSGSSELCFLSMANACLSGKVQRDMTVWLGMDRQVDAWAQGVEQRGHRRATRRLASVTRRSATPRGGPRLRPVGHYCCP